MQKGKYNIYEPYMDFLVRDARKNHMDMRKKSRDDIEKMLALGIYDNSLVDGESDSQLDFKILNDDTNWRNSSQVVIFPESIDVLDRINSSKFEIKSEAAIKFPHSSFILSFPREYRIRGKIIKGVLVNYSSLGERIENSYLNYLNKKFNLKTHIAGIFDKTDLELSFVYQDPFDDSYIRFEARKDTLKLALGLKNFEDYVEKIKPRDEFKTKSHFKLTMEEYAYQFELLNLILKIGVYTSACEEAIEEGYPGKPPKHLSPKGLNYKPYTLDSITNKKQRARGYQVKGHVRGWTFRTLMHEKYYQGEHKDEERGSRVVFVPDYEVNLPKITPETLK